MTLNSILVSKTHPTYDLVVNETNLQIKITFRNNGDEIWYQELHPDYPPVEPPWPWYRRVFLEGYNAIAKSCMIIPLENLNNNVNGIKLSHNTFFNTSFGHPDTNEFIFQFRAPATTGTYNLQFRLIRQNRQATGPSQWDTTYDSFGEIVTVQIIVKGPANAQLVSNTFPSQMEIAERGTALITLKNTGAWAWDYNFRIEAKTVATTYFSKSWFYVPLGVSVAPGSNFTFQIPLRANCNAGTYNTQYRLFWNRIQNNFGDIASKTVRVIPVTHPIQNLNEYNWKSLTARRSTADIAWSYNIDIDGVDIPDMFVRLQHQEGGYLAMLGYPAEYEISTDVPDVMSNVGAYSAGYFLSNIIPIKSNIPVANPQGGLYIRQSRAGSDIKPWQQQESNIAAIQPRVDEIKTFENPSHYIARILFYVNDATGKVDTTKPGPYGLWATDTRSTIAEKAVTGGIPTIRPVPNWGIGRYTGSDGNQYVDGDTIPPGVTLTQNNPSATCLGWDNRHPTTADPGMVEKKQFSYDGKKIIDILDELAEHCNMIYFTRFVKVGAEWREYFYWVPKFGVALGWLGVSQSPLEIRPDNNNLVGSPGISASIVLEDNFNCVWVEACRKKDSAWFYAFDAPISVKNGTEIARPLYYRSHDLLPDPVGNVFLNPDGSRATLTTTTQFGPDGLNYGNPTENARCRELVSNKARQLLNLLDYEVPTFTATFQNIELDLYRVIKFIGFTGLSNFNGVEMQIIDVEKSYNPPSDGGYQITVTCAPKQRLQESGKFQSVIDEIQDNYDKLIQGIETSDVDDKLSLIISTYDEGSMCNAQLRSTGNMIKTRTYGYRTSSG